MEHRKHGGILLGLLVAAALGVMALAASAQALTPAFLINKAPVGNLLATVTGVLEVVGTMKVSPLKFELNCTALKIDEGHILSNTQATAVLLYSGCSTLSLPALPTVTEIDCHVLEPIQTEALLLPTETNAGEPAVLAENIKALVTLHLKGTPLLKEKVCILPLDNTVTGTVCFEITLGSNNTAGPLLIPGATCGGTADELKYGGWMTTLEGPAAVAPTGTDHLTLGVALI
jgi:hypothetical protein